jgi:hypothetical protein
MRSLAPLIAPGMVETTPITWLHNYFIGVVSLKFPSIHPWGVAMVPARQCTAVIQGQPRVSRSARYPGMNNTNTGTQYKYRDSRESRVPRVIQG